MSGKVYFVSAPGRIKIGFTRNPDKRLTALRHADMEELTVLAIIDGPRSLERKLHQLLSAHRLRREWFADCQEVRSVIDEAIAGKHRIERTIITAADVRDENFVWPEEPPPPCTPEFEIIKRLAADTEAAIERNDDKYELRGRFHALHAAVTVFIEQRERLLPLKD